MLLRRPLDGQAGAGGPQGPAGDAVPTGRSSPISTRRPSAMPGTSTAPPSSTPAAPRHATACGWPTVAQARLLDPSATSSTVERARPATSSGSPSAPRRLARAGERRSWSTGSAGWRRPAAWRSWSTPTTTTTGPSRSTDTLGFTPLPDGLVVLGSVARAAGRDRALRSAATRGRGLAVVATVLAVAGTALGPVPAQAQTSGATTLRLVSQKLVLAPEEPLTTTLAVGDTVPDGTELAVTVSSRLRPASRRAARASSTRAPSSEARWITSRSPWRRCLRTPPAA